MTLELASSVTVAPGEAVFIGGLDQSTENDGANGLRFLPRWMWTQSSDTSQVQLLMLLQVDVVEVPGGAGTGPSL